MGSPPAPKIPTHPRAGIGERAKESTTEGQSQLLRPEPPARSGPKPTWATGGTARWASGDGRTTSAGTQTSRTAGPGAMCLAPRTPTTLADKAGTTALSRTAKVRTREKRIQTCTTASSGQGTPCANTLAQRRSVLRKRRWTDQCDFGHDSNRKLLDGSYCGQNAASGYSTSGAAVQGWYSEVENMEKDCVPSDSKSC